MRAALKQLRDSIDPNSDNLIEFRAQPRDELFAEELAESIQPRILTFRSDSGSRPPPQDDPTGMSIKNADWVRDTKKNNLFGVAAASGTAARGASG